jgi:hypothetical protein
MPRDLAPLDLSKPGLHLPPFLVGEAVDAVVIRCVVKDRSRDPFLSLFGNSCNASIASRMIFVMLRIISTDRPLAMKRHPPRDKSCKTALLAIAGKFPGFLVVFCGEWTSG